MWAIRPRSGSGVTVLTSFKGFVVPPSGGSFVAIRQTAVGVTSFRLKAVLRTAFTSFRLKAVLRTAFTSFRLKAVLRTAFTSFRLKAVLRTVTHTAMRS
jgi:hypothetical protein